MSAARDRWTGAGDEHVRPAMPAGHGGGHAPWKPIGAANIADPFADLLDLLSKQKRQGLISLMSARYYEGWRPGRAEIADLVAVELGALTMDNYEKRQRRRDEGDEGVPDITPTIRMRVQQQRTP